MTDADSSVWDADELADPRIIGTRDLVDSLGASIADVLINARDRALERLQTEYGDAPVAGVSNFDGIARNAITIALTEGDVRRLAEPTIEDSVRRTLTRLGSDNHFPKIQRDFGAQHGQRVRFVSRSIVLDTRAAADDMLDRMRTRTRNVAMAGGNIDDVVDNIRNDFDDGTIGNRARLIARMNIQQAITTTKLSEYDLSPDIGGFRIINPCTQTTTRLCKHLAGCGAREAVTVSFDDDRSISAQLQAQVSDDLLFNGFRPIPPVPPFHFGCRSDIAPAFINT